MADTGILKRLDPNFGLEITFEYESTVTQEPKSWHISSCCWNNFGSRYIVKVPLG